MPGLGAVVAVRIDGARVDMFGFAAIEARLRAMVGAPVDLMGEPAPKPGMQAEIDNMVASTCRQST